MKFEDYEHSYFPKRWEYLDKSIFTEYHSSVFLNQYIWNRGNGSWEGYDVPNSRFYWDENLIFKL